jgi:Fur family peroxide stress response transcriptional regulator
VLDALVENALIKKVKTERDIMRYDAVMENHHHLYCSDSDRIEDYKNNNEELNGMLKKYFKKNRIPGFKIEDIKLQIIGRFINSEK